MHQSARIDLNSDLGESFGRWQLGDDPAMLRIVTSANVACGFHAGDASTLRRTCADAAAAGVVIGAQVSYRDLEGFGRRFVDIEPRALTDDVLYQLSALDGLARISGGRVRYLKPHGALYNAIVHHREQAAAVVQAVCEYDDTLPVLGLAGSVFLDIAEQAGLRVVREAFADRAYNLDGTLVSRGEPGAVLTDPDEVVKRIPDLVRAADSICVHSDTAGAVEIARRVREALDAEQISVRPFVDGADAEDADADDAGADHTA